MALRAPCIALSLVVGVGLVAHGCGPTNKDACLAYVDKVNGEYATCGLPPAIDDPGATCPDYLNSGGADCAEYYQCLSDAVTCEGNTIVYTDDQGRRRDRLCTGCT